MGDSVSFSELNERLRPRFTAMERLCSSLSTLEDRQLSLRSSSCTPRPTVLPQKPEQPQATTEPEEPEEDMVNQGHEQEDTDDYPSLTEDGNGDDLLTLINQCLTPGLSVEDNDDQQGLAVVQENDGSSLDGDGRSPTPTGETGEEHSQTAAQAKGDGSPHWRNYMDGTLPDLIRSGRPLSRRRTLGPVSDTLKEVRREVELSRRRSLRLKAQVDKLQEGRDGPGWSKHRERVTDEVLSILRLLLPLTEPESSAAAEPSDQDGSLDTALSQLQAVARKLAISHTQQGVRSGGQAGHGAEDSVILQQALWDRDEAIEKKKAMEAELLRSKTELMMLNNQLLEAVQRRLELSLELEAWKEDVQLILQQQLQNQQRAEAEAEQAQKKSSRLGLLRRNNKPLVQRPASFPVPVAAPAASGPITMTNQVFINKASSSVYKPPPSPGVNVNAAAAAPQRNWRDRLKRGKTGRQGDQDAVGQPSPSTWGRQEAYHNREEAFHNVSLD